MRFLFILTILTNFYIFCEAQGMEFSSFYVSTQGASQGTLTLVKDNPKKYTGKVVEWQFKLFKKGVIASVESKSHTGLISSKTLAGAIKRLENCQWVDRAYAKFFSDSYEETCDCCNYIGPIAKLSYIRTSDKVIENFKTALNFEEWAEEELSNRFNAKQVIEAINKELKSKKPGQLFKNYVKLLKSSKDNLNALQYKLSSFDYSQWMSVESDMLIVYGNIDELKNNEKSITPSISSSPSNTEAGFLYDKSWTNKTGSKVKSTLSIKNGYLTATLEESFIRKGAAKSGKLEYKVPLQKLKNELQVQKKKIYYSQVYPWHNGFYCNMLVPEAVVQALYNKSIFGQWQQHEDGVVKRDEKVMSITLWSEDIEGIQSIKALLCRELKICTD